MESICNTPICRMIPRTSSFVARFDTVPSPCAASNNSRAASTENSMGPTSSRPSRTGYPVLDALADKTAHQERAALYPAVGLGVPGDFSSLRHAYSPLSLQRDYIPTLLAPSALVWPCRPVDGRHVFFAVSCLYRLIEAGHDGLGDSHP